jgi:hypothetical protein
MNTLTTRLMICAGYTLFATDLLYAAGADVKLLISADLIHDRVFSRGGENWLSSTLLDW